MRIRWGEFAKEGDHSAEGAAAQIATDSSPVSARLLRAWVAVLVQAAAIPQLARV